MLYQRNRWSEATAKIHPPEEQKKKSAKSAKSAGVKKSVEKQLYRSLKPLL